MIHSPNKSKFDRKYLNAFIQQITTISKIFPFLWPSDWNIRLRFLLGLFLLASTIVFNIGVPLFLRYVINIISNQSTALLLAETVLILYGLLWVLSKVSEQLRLFTMIRVIERGIRLISLKIFDHLINLSLHYHSNRETGAIVNAIERAQSAFPNLIWGLFFTIFPTLVEVLIAACILTYFYGYIYGLVLAVILFIYTIISVIGTGWSTLAMQKANEKYAKTSNRIVDSLLNYETIRYFGNQKYEYDRCNKLLAEREDAVVTQHARAELVILSQSLIMGSGLIFLTLLSGLQVLHNEFRISDFVLINAYLLQFMMPLGQFGYVFRSINEGLTNFKDVLKILNEKSEIIEIENAKPLIINNGIITFDQVEFGYDRRRKILNKVSFKIPKKSTVAIVGSTGAGKSTIAKLLFRFYDVARGKIMIDDQDIKQVTLASLHHYLGIVSQHTALFHDTLRYNITYSKPDATENEIDDVISQAHLGSLIKDLPDGLNTIIGEQGFKLSGGERQRVAIARVLLKKPKIFIFDEATSSLDSKTERVIQQNISEISKGATTVIIAHRLSTIVHAEQIIVLDKGKVVEQGTHFELLKLNGIYAFLWNKQIAEHSQNKDD